MVPILRCPQLIAVHCQVLADHIQVGILAINPLNPPDQTLTLYDPKTLTPYPCRVPADCPPYNATLERINGPH